jgi:hypothetical protein
VRYERGQLAERRRGSVCQRRGTQQQQKNVRVSERYTANTNAQLVRKIRRGVCMCAKIMSKYKVCAALWREGHQQGRGSTTHSEKRHTNTQQKNTRELSLCKQYGHRAGSGEGTTEGDPAQISHSDETEHSGRQQALHRESIIEDTVPERDRHRYRTLSHNFKYSHVASAKIRRAERVT